MKQGFGRAGRMSLGALLMGATVLHGVAALAQDHHAAARKWIADEFQPSVLSQEEQAAEMDWFTTAAEPFRGMEINVVSENIPTHTYESQVLTRAFEEITGIKVRHDLLQEGDVIEKLQTQLASGQNIYDAYVNDSDLIGTHFRYGAVMPLDDFMAGDGKDVTSPTLDLADFMGLSFTTAPDGKVYMLPDQQFANLYWFRQDLFTRPELMERFKARYGYDLGVPVNWSAYEDIAEFFTKDVKEIDGAPIYGHMDYGKKDPSLGWRYTDAWFSMAGTGDKGLPNGKPVDEWGIRVEDCHPTGSSVTRGGDINGPAAVYALSTSIRWLKDYAPAEAQGMTFYEYASVPTHGNIAQQAFWYTAFTADYAKENIPVVDDDGNPKWRVAPSPHGAYWQEGMKLGYQDAGSWLLLKSTPTDRAKAAWLYAQFVTSKTVDVHKSHIGLTFVRDSTIRHDSFTERAPKLGGLVEFYRSPARVMWTPTGTNVPDYPKLAQLWWQNISTAISGETTVQQALDNLATAQDKVMERLERAGVMTTCGPKLNKESSAEDWYARAEANPDWLAPQRKLADEKPRGETVSYDALLDAWASGKAKPDGL